jgi:hypothetical protein
MRVLGCFGTIASFAAGCAVTFGIMSLRPLADPIGQVLFETSRTAGAAPQEETGVINDITSALRVLTSSIQTDDPTRTWRHRDGRQIRATILSATAATVTIKRESDGRVFTIQQDVLASGDREFVQRWRLERGH